MTTFIKRILSWILPPEDAQEAAREHLRENVYIANKESIDNPPARDHVGRKDGVWDNTVDNVIQMISSPSKKVNSIYRMDDNCPISPSIDWYLRPSHVFCHDPLRQNNLENEIKCPCCVNNNNNGNNLIIGTLKFHRFRSYQNNKKKYRICLDADGEYPILIATYKCTVCKSIITSTSDNLNLPEYVLQSCPFVFSQTKVWTKKLHSMIMGRTIDGTSAGQIELEVKRAMGERWVSSYFQYLSHLEYYNNTLVPNCHFRARVEPQEWPELDELCGTFLSSDTIRERFLAEAETVYPFADRAMQTIGCTTAAHDATFKIAGAIRHEGRSVIGCHAEIANECSQIMTRKWCTNETFIEKQAMAQDIWNRLTKYGDLHVAQNDTVDEIERQRNSEPQIITDLCCNDHNWWKIVGFKRNPILDLFHLRERITKAIKNKGQQFRENWATMIAYLSGDIAKALRGKKPNNEYGANNNPILDYWLPVGEDPTPEYLQVVAANHANGAVDGDVAAAAVDGGVAAAAVDGGVAAAVGGAVDDGGAVDGGVAAAAAGGAVDDGGAGAGAGDYGVPNDDDLNPWNILSCLTLVRQKWSVGVQALWTIDIDKAIKNQIKHIFHCIRLAAGLPSTVKDRHNNIKQTRGTSKLESFHKYLNKLPNGTWGIARADAIVTMATLDWNYRAMIQYDNRWPEHLRVAFHMLPIVAAVGALELRLFADPTKRKLPLYPLLDINRQQDRMIYGWRIDQYTVRDAYDDAHPSALVVPADVPNPALSLLNDVLATTSDTPRMDEFIDGVLCVGCACHTTMCSTGSTQHSLPPQPQGSPQFGLHNKISHPGTETYFIRRTQHSSNKVSTTQKATENLVRAQQNNGRLTIKGVLDESDVDQSFGPEERRLLRTLTEYVSGKAIEDLDKKDLGNDKLFKYVATIYESYVNCLNSNDSTYGLLKPKRVETIKNQIKCMVPYEKHRTALRKQRMGKGMIKNKEELQNLFNSILKMSTITLDSCGNISGNDLIEEAEGDSSTEMDTTNNSTIIAPMATPSAVPSTPRVPPSTPRVPPTTPTTPTTPTQMATITAINSGTIDNTTRDDNEVGTNAIPSISIATILTCSDFKETQKIISSFYTSTRDTSSQSTKRPRSNWDDRANEKLKQLVQCCKNEHQQCSPQLLRDLLYHLGGFGPYSTRTITRHLNMILPKNNTNANDDGGDSGEEAEVSVGEEQQEFGIGEKDRIQEKRSKDKKGQRKRFELFGWAKSDKKDDYGPEWTRVAYVRRESSGAELVVREDGQVWGETKRNGFVTLSKGDWVKMRGTSQLVRRGGGTTEVESLNCNKDDLKGRCRGLKKLL